MLTCLIMPSSSPVKRKKPDSPDITKRCKLETISVIAKALFEKTQTYKCTPSDTVQDLRQRIYKKTGKRANIIFQSKKLEETQTLHSQGIKHNSVVELTFKKGAKVKTVLLTTTTGRELKIPATPNMTVGELRKAVHKRTEILPKDQRLICAGISLLNDEQRLSTFAIQSTLRVYNVLMLKGGMFHCSSARNDMIDLT